MDSLQAVILCGGQGTRLHEETGTKPKPMVKIGERPILWHIMKSYAHFGVNRYVLCLGYLGHMIKRYFHDYRLFSQDFTVQLGSHDIQYHHGVAEDGWEVTLADTGPKAMTGCRVKRIEKYITGDTFLLTYGDGVCDVDIQKLVEYHRSHGKLATVTGVFPASRFGELVVDGDSVTEFQEKPHQVGESGLINGGFFVLDRKVFEYLEDDEGCILERTPMERLAADGELKVFKHSGFWQCMDTSRDLNYLRGWWDRGEAPWRHWA